MTDLKVLRFTPVDHPDPRVGRIGFDLQDPYVEQCWSAVIGPSSTLVLRRFPTMWIASVPAEIDASEMARSLGLGESVGDRSRFTGTLDRIVRFGLARPAHDGTGLDVYRQVAPLSERQLSRLPEWTQAAHDRLIVPHLERLSTTTTQQSTVADVTAMLDRIQHSRPLAAHAPAHALQP